MPTLVSGTDCVVAWKSVCQLLYVPPHHLDHVIVEVSRPTCFRKAWSSRYDPRPFDSGALRSLSDVANTIFPEALWRRAQTRQEFYERYAIVFDRGKRRRANRTTWGTYFRRMIDFGPDHVNRLEQIIAAMNSWHTATRVQFVLHLSAQGTDALRTISGPCLQYMQFLPNRDGKIDLLVVVRNHDYFRKALGNFIGLGRLLAFVASETSRVPGKLICHSVHAYNGRNSITALRELAA